jgi:hypothetical protein
MKEIGGGHQKIDTGVCLQRVDQAGESLIRVPLGRDPCDDLDRILILVKNVEKPVATLNGILVTEVADEDRCFVFTPSRFASWTRAVTVSAIILRLSA